jgi:ribosome-associated toxin RatA of RatAB toxin-antitoxin module
MDIADDDKLAGILDDSVVVSVAVKSSPDHLYELVTDIERLSDFFPQIEFKRGSEGPLEVGSIYYTRRKGTKNWVAYRVLILEPNARMSAELAGKDRLFEALRYDHRFFVDGSDTVSHEKVEYKFRYGIVGRIFNLMIGKRLVREQILNAHLRLKEKAEELSVLQ